MCLGNQGGFKCADEPDSLWSHTLFVQGSKVTVTLAPRWRAFWGSKHQRQSGLRRATHRLPHVSVKGIERNRTVPVGANAVDVSILIGPSSFGKMGVGKHVVEQLHASGPNIGIVITLIRVVPGPQTIDDLRTLRDSPSDDCNAPVAFQ